MALTRKIFFESRMDVLKNHLTGYKRAENFSFRAGKPYSIKVGFRSDSLVSSPVCGFFKSHQN
jgi:hypothetical protein